MKTLIFSPAAALISWLSGSANVAASVKRRAEIKGDIGSSDALAYLRGILEICKAAGYEGLLIVIDEAETILRMRSDSRHKSLNGIRQICDAAGEYPGLLWLFTGTPDFFDARQGVAGLAPLHDRIRFLESGRQIARLEDCPRASIKGQGMIWIVRNGVTEIQDGCGVGLLLELRPASIVIGLGRSGIEVNGFRVVSNGVVDFAIPQVGDTPSIVEHGAAGKVRDQTGAGANGERRILELFAVA